MENKLLTFQGFCLFEVQLPTFYKCKISSHDVIIPTKLF